MSEKNKQKCNIIASLITNLFADWTDLAEQGAADGREPRYTAKWEMVRDSIIETYRGPE
jgi:hypothetical protein